MPSIADGKTHLSNSHSQPKLQPLLEKGRKSTIAKNILCQLVNLSRQGK
jgi:hypothetical protein